IEFVIRKFRAVATFTIFTYSRHSRILKEQRENARIPIQAVVRYFAVAKKSDQRKFAESLSYHIGLFGFAAEQVRPATDAGIVQASARAAKHPALYAVEHARHVFGGAGFVASAEHDLRASARHVADGHQFLHGIDAHQITNQIIAGIGSSNRKSREDIGAGLRKVFPVRFADIFPENIECGASVERDEDILLAAGNGVSRTDRRTALC